MKNWKSNDVLTSQYEILTDPLWMKKHICREWESNPRSLDYMSGVLTNAPSRQPCWKQSDQRGDLLAAGSPAFFHSGTGLHRIIRRRFTGYQKYQIIFRMKNWKSNDVVTSQYEILTDPFWMKKHICCEWESNPRSLDYMSGVLTTAPSRQPCWKQSNQRGDLLAAGLPGVLSFRNRTTSDHPKKIHRLPEIPNYI